MRGKKISDIETDPSTRAELIHAEDAYASIESTVTGRLALEVLRLRSDLHEAKENANNPKSRRERRRLLSNTAAIIMMQYPRMSKHTANALARHRLTSTSKPSLMPRELRTPLFFQKTNMNDNGSATNEAWFLKFYPLPITPVLPFIKLGGFVQQRTEGSTEISETPIFSVFMDYHEGTIAVEEAGKDITFEEDLYVILGAVQAARDIVSTS